MVRPSIPSVCAALAAFTATASVSVPLAAQEAPPTWEQFATRTPPAWFADAKFGIFIHWGVYSVPAFCDTSTYSEWYQYWLDTNSHGGLVRKFHERVYGKDFPYHRFAESFKAELWDPAQWAKVFRRAGAQYIVITSKHHDGFCLWPSDVASEVRGHPWNAVATGPRRDVIGELAAAVRAEGIRFGTYYSFLEWHDPVFEKSIPDYVERVMFPQVKDLIARYHPDVFWPDGEWDHPDTTWRSRELLQWLYANVPNAAEFVVNDRWGKGLRGRVGDFFTTEYGDFGGGGDNYSGQRTFEECRGIGHSFAWNRREDYDVYQSRTESVRTLIDMCSRGGNLLLDIGPAADGTIPLIMVDRLYAIGDWLAVNGEAIHGTRKSPFRTTPWGRATAKGNTVYLHVFDLPKSGRLAVPLQNDPVAARVLGGAAVAAKRTESGVEIDLRGVAAHEHATVVALELTAAPVEDPRFLPDGDGVVTLPATAGVIAGKALKLEGHVDRHQSATVQNLGYWNTVGDAVAWRDVVVPGGGVMIEAELAVAPGSEGGELSWRLGTRSGTFTIPESTGGWQSYRRVVIGTAMLHPGADELRLTAASVKGQALCNIRAIRLVPDRRGLAIAAAVADSRQAEVLPMLTALKREREAGRPQGVAALYADDARILGAGERPVAGRAELDAHWASRDKVLRWDLDVRDTQVHRNLAVVSGRSTVVTAAGEQVTDFVLTFRLEDDGTWRIVSDVHWPARS